MLDYVGDNFFDLEAVQTATVERVECRHHNTGRAHCIERTRAKAVLASSLFYGKNGKSE